jgi:hypothetical protein
MWYSSLQSAFSGGDVVAGAFKLARELGRIHSMGCGRDKNACCVIDGVDMLIYGALIGHKVNLATRNWR